MARRLKLTLVYFGLVEDPELEAYLDKRPMNTWRVAAVTLFVGVAAALAVGLVLQRFNVAAWIAGLVIGLAVGIASLRSRRQQARERDLDA